jgi:hypothetical protein
MDISKIAGILLASSTLLAPAMAQPLTGRVAVGPIGSPSRVWTSVSDAQALCSRNGCWVTDGIEVTPGNWVPNTQFPSAKQFQEAGTGFGLLEVPRSRP